MKAIDDWLSWLEHAAFTDILAALQRRAKMV